MDDADRFHLLGTYRTPRFRIGQRVRCLVRGEVIITGITEAPIPWPIGKVGRGCSLVVYKGLPPRRNVSRARYRCQSLPLALLSQLLVFPEGGGKCWSQ